MDNTTRWFKEFPWLKEFSNINDIKVKRIDDVLLRLVCTPEESLYIVLNNKKACYVKHDGINIRQTISLIGVDPLMITHILLIAPTHKKIPPWHNNMTIYKDNGYIQATVECYYNFFA